MSERSLIPAARRGDANAIRALYRCHGPRIHALTRRILMDDALAEDAAQDAWLRAIRALPEFREGARFGTWLHRIAVNCALQRLRAHRRGSGREVALPGSLTNRGAAVRPLLNVRLERALAALPARMRAVLVLHDVEGYTHLEIGEMLEIADGTSKSQLFKARARMRELLSPPVRKPVDRKDRQEISCRT